MGNKEPQPNGGLSTLGLEYKTWAYPAPDGLYYGEQI